MDLGVDTIWATIFCISSPETGLISKPSLSAASLKIESLTIRSKDSRRARTRSAGTAGAT